MGLFSFKNLNMHLTMGCGLLHKRRTVASRRRDTGQLVPSCLVCISASAATPFKYAMHGGQDRGELHGWVAVCGGWSSGQFRAR